MALIPTVLRPAFVIRRNAIRKGVFGPSAVWKLVAVAVFARGAISKFGGRSPDQLGRRSLRVGQTLSIAVVAPLGRKQAKRAGITKKTLEAGARAELAAARPAS